ncbi:related to KRI1-KRRI-Interacting protein 1 [Sporisorium scitamineum]|uniref:Related to KRI1-KRRI-Interacting protein 1 n=1 Tax=Sporisorium scitamineum TaxID=49012 RepID=A0A0F7SAX5_9BASI|nr:related to KRI1-KRRI-Interacting protein 1 [Sporisorium scitamineum]CDW97858.1 hypothetical protein [Sporisorium scitamineum]
MDLFGESNDTLGAKLDIRTRPEESLNHFTINKEFAERYLHNKQRAEIHQLEAKYGKDALASDDDDDSETDSESDVTEDEDGDQINANVDAAIFRTLQRIRNKDAALYDSKTDIFAQEAKAAQCAAQLSGASTSSAPKKSGTTEKDKKLTLQDYQRQRVQELIETSENPAEALADATTSDRVKGIFNNDNGDGERRPFAQEQEDLRKEVSQAFHAGIGDEDDLFVKRSETQNGDGTSSYRDAVLASLGPNADEDTILQAIRRNQPDETSASTSVLANDTEAEQKKNEDFLLNYILNRGWIDKSADEARPVKPRLTKAVLKSKDAAENSEAAAGSQNGDGATTAGQAYGRDWGRDWEAEAAELESEASFDSMADAFETAYNFRFEQGPESLTIPTYSRTPKDSARREDNTRKRKREERAARKDEEKRLKMQELSRLKNLKRQEIVDKLKKLREVTGSSAVDLDSLDLEADFDPDAHDKAMEKAFGDQYYQDDDDEKPSWDDDINIDDIIAEHEANTASSNKKGKKAKQSHAAAEEDDDRIEMDADFLDGDDAAPAEAGGSKEAVLRARLADKKLSKKERKKLKKKLKAALSKSSTGGDASDSDADAADDGVDVSAMDADAPTNPTDKKAMAKEMIDSYYNLDYEDMIGDLPTRFKYTQVAPADYGMSAVDILLADDEQLNNVVGLKNLQPYRRGKNRPVDLGKRLGQFRKDVYGNTSKTQDGQEKPARKRLGKKERNRLKAAGEGGADGQKAD